MLSLRYWLFLAALVLPLSAVGCGDDDSKANSDEDTKDEERPDEDKDTESDDDSTGKTKDASVRDASQMDATVRPGSSDASTDAGAKHDAAAHDDGGSNEGPKGLDASTPEDASAADAKVQDARVQDAKVQDAKVDPEDAATAKDAGYDAGDLTMPLPRGTCGTFLDVKCPVSQYCDYSELAGGSGCHVPGGRGVCKPIPSNCDAEQTLPVCTCDGALYWKPCLAILAGQTVDYGNAACIIPPLPPPMP
ncbi:MAG TPA: hypothetical protein VI299_17115 [Polyangiales bacterium]